MNQLKHYMRRILSPDFRMKLRKKKRHLLNSLKGKRPKTSLDDLRNALVGLGVSQGDYILVTSSFGQLNADFSPDQVVDMLKGLVGEDGLIMMPFYPPMNSTEWAAKGETFDARSVKAVTGVLTNVFAHSEGVLMSHHPTKSVCVWGRKASEFVTGHENSTTPFYWDSPYGKLLKAGSKSVGLGVKNLPVIHAIEDVLSPEYSDYYQPDKYALQFIDLEGNEKTIETYVHNEQILNRCVLCGLDYAKRIGCESYKSVDFGYSSLYVLDNQDFLETARKPFAEGLTRLSR